ncbi:hypothetical protein [Streptosporangium oxazolinicum]
MVIGMTGWLALAAFWLIIGLILFFIIYGAVRLALKHDRRSQGR